MTHLLVRELDRAVQKTVFAHDALGCNVSGGLDSSTVIRLAHKWRGDIPTFTGFYEVPGYDERLYARMAVGLFTRNHHEIPITPRHFVEYFDEALAAFAPPWQGPGMFGQWMVAKFIHDTGTCRVVMSGEGSDELFGGYARLMKVAGGRLPDGYENYQPPADYPKTVEAALEYDYERLPDLLAVDDAALGAFGLGAVAPFTDPNVVRYALGLHPQDRVGKLHLRTAVRGIVPDPIIDRTDKMGMPAPFVVWANEPGNPVRDFVGDRIGYIPDVSKPFDRKWWYEMCDATRVPLAA